jgi:VWFA-related protein
MNSVSALARRIVVGGIVATFLGGVAVVPHAQSPSQQGLFQNNGTPVPRSVVLLFDTNSLSLSEAQTVIASALDWIDGTADLTSIVTTGAKLNVLSDFTADRAALSTVLRSEAFLQAVVDAGAGQQAVRFGGNNSVENPDAARADDSQRAEQRVRGIATLCETVGTIQARKAIVYFSKGLRTSAGDSYTVALRAATNACNRANVTINPIDARGLIQGFRAPAK